MMGTITAETDVVHLVEGKVLVEVEEDDDEVEHRWMIVSYLILVCHERIENESIILKVSMTELVKVKKRKKSNATQISLVKSELNLNQI